MNDQGFKPYRYYDRTFPCKKDLVLALLQEANEIINKINQNKIDNNRYNRNQACWRLNYLSHYLTDPELKIFQIQCNSTWSQLYHLEHRIGEEHPYIKKLKTTLLLK